MVFQKSSEKTVLGRFLRNGFTDGKLLLGLGYQTLKIAGLCHVPVVSYSKNILVHWLLAPIVILKTPIHFHGKMRLLTPYNISKVQLRLLKDSCKILAERVKTPSPMDVNICLFWRSTDSRLHQTIYEIEGFVEQIRLYQLMYYGHIFGQSFTVQKFINKDNLKNMLFERPVFG